MDPLAFERLLAGYFRDEGYEVDHSGTGNSASSFDGGVDLRLRKDGRLTLVQCKRETAYQVTHNVVHELLGIKVNENAAEAIVITSGEFTEAARRAGATGHVRLIEGIELRRLLGSRLDDLPQRRVAQPSDYSTWEPLRIAEDRTRQFSALDSKKKRKPEGELLAAVVVLILLYIVVRALFGGHSTPATRSVDPSGIVSPPAERAVPRGVDTPTAAESWSLQPDASASAAPERSVKPEASQPRRLSAAEQARRDEEMRRYLERVPEVTHYRYSPLEQYRDPPRPADQSQAAAPP
jgi:hypothetical protein